MCLPCTATYIPGSSSFRAFALLLPSSWGTTAIQFSLGYARKKAINSSRLYEYGQNLDYVSPVIDPVDVKTKKPAHTFLKSTDLVKIGLRNMKIFKVQGFKGKLDSSTCIFVEPYSDRGTVIFMVPEYRKSYAHVNNIWCPNQWCWRYDQGVLCSLVCETSLDLGIFEWLLVASNLPAMLSPL